MPILKVNIFTFTIMHDKFVNLTGAKSYNDILKAINLFKEHSKISRIFNFKIDSISAVECNSNLKFEDFLGNDDFTLKVHPRFGGKTVRSKKYRVAVNIFESSRKCVFMGLKCLDQVKIFNKE